MQGFDYEAVPRWQMIPMTESRYIVLRDGAGLVVTSLSPAVATVTEIATRELPRGPFSEERFRSVLPARCGRLGLHPNSDEDRGG